MNLQNLIDYCKINELPSPLDGVITPDPINSEIVKSYIMIRCGLLTPVYNDPDTFREAARVWFAARSWEFEHLVNILRAKYSPIENVDRYDEWTKDTTGGYKNAESGTDRTIKDASNQLSGSDTRTNNATDGTSGADIETTTRATENTISAFNSGGYQPDNKTQDSGDLITKYGKTEGHNETDVNAYGRREDIDDDTATTYGHMLDNSHDDKEHFIQHLHGNVGVTSNEKLINEEIDLLERFNVYDWIASQFESDMMICVY
ncbi:MAG: hypothetical protein VZR54_09320 [Ruminococcus sp.]|nr:hypothetical protein [Ruminococcus sp.]